MRRVLTGLLAFGFAGAAAAQPVEIKVLAAGSLRAALGEVAGAYEAPRPGQKVQLGFGASGLLKDRLLAGEAAQVFASANMEHPQALAAAGRAAPPQAFASNRLCALAAPTLDVSSATLIDRLLDPAVRVGTSTPRADPAGDYTWQMFERIEQQGRPGAFATLSAKALQLTGGPSSAPPPAERNVYGALLESRQADLFITYCTNAVIAAREVPALRLVEVPAAVNVAARYGIALLNGAPEPAQGFVRFLLGAEGQGVLARHGFAPP